MYTGPSKNPLLPSNFDGTDNPLSQSQDNDDNASGSLHDISNSVSGWKDAKTSMSNYATGRTSNYRRTVSSHIKAYGGAKKASGSAKAGVRTSVNFGRFFSSASSEGIKGALENAKIEYEGRTAKDILNDIINFLAPIPVTKEDSVARKALIRTMEALYERLEDENNDISTLEAIDKEHFNIIMLIQIESYLYERIINDLGSRIETNATSPADAVRKENELKEYINSKVETTLSGRDFSEIDFKSRNIDKEIESLFYQCYKVMEDML
jgi:hypothetical protein